LQDAGFSAKREFKSPPKRGDILVSGQGGSVLFYVIGHDRKTVRHLVSFLQQQDYSGVLFTSKPTAGAFSLDQAKIESPDAPDVVMSMRWSEEKSDTGAPGLLVADNSGKSAKGSHASLSPFDRHNILIGDGPDLKSGFADTLPTGNIDLAPTVLWLLGVKFKQPMDGRVLSEALTVDAPPAGEPVTERLEAVREQEGSTWRQYLQISRVNHAIYLDEGNGVRVP
jgi:hypothetical protein